MWPRILPFASYMAFVAIHGLVTSWPGLEVEDGILWLYPIKIGFVSLVLLHYRKSYTELKVSVFSGIGEVVLACGVGIFVYLAWVRMNFSWASQGPVGGYNPFEAAGSRAFYLAGFRLLGASLVVPIMEELFWRSFLIRFIVSADFLSLPLGKFTVNSFVISTLLFGVEHHLWLAGMMAGAAYTLLLYKTGRIWSCILAHGVTNFALGLHVLVTQEWFWW